MPSKFQSMFQRTARPALIRNFGESVSYFAYGGRAARAVNAVVERNGYRDEDGRWKATWQVSVANSGTLGISGTELRLGQDQIALAPKDGESVVKKTIVDIISQDSGMLVLQCH